MTPTRCTTAFVSSHAVRRRIEAAATAHRRMSGLRCASTSSSSSSSSAATTAEVEKKPRANTTIDSSDAAGAGLVKKGARGDFGGRWRVADILRHYDTGGGGGVLDDEMHSEPVTVRGWVRTVRDQKQFAFVDVNDGSSLSGLQVVVDGNSGAYALVRSGDVTTGAAIRATGHLVRSVGGKQNVELKCSELSLVGGCDARSYVLQKKRHSLEFLRNVAHLRPRTNTIGAAMRVRSRLAQATHEFFDRNGFVYVHTPIVTASDCEGAGEQFCVTTLPTASAAESGEAVGSNGNAPDVAGLRDEATSLEARVAEQGSRVRELKAAVKEDTAPPGTDVKAEVDALLALKAQLADLEGRIESGGTKTSGESRSVDYSQDFFGRQAFLTVSGQLNAEIMASAMGDVYTFGPTFRAENSNTSRHLAEFWMIEPELAFASLDDDIDCASAYLRHCVKAVLTECAEDIAFFDKHVSDGLVNKLQCVVDNAGSDGRVIERITYTEAVELLQKSSRKFEYDVEWGIDLQSEHERYLCEEVFNGKPLAVTDYPKNIKPFYMRLNEDNKTVACMDILVPGVGELIGGSAREERLPVLLERMREMGMDEAPYWWYIDLRKYGSVPHAGFGLGFERLVQFCTGLTNIRDVIPFPRYPGSAEF